jgi:sialate O-acetylesterase
MNHDEEVAAADHPFLRLFIVKRVEADQPADDVTGAWEVCTPKTAARFSAVAYFFGRDLEGRLHVPMGLIESNWGGTPAQSWTSREALQNDPALQYVAGEWQRVLADPALRKPYPTAPFRLYNAMIAPLTPYAIRGAIWYQGESNTSETHAFRYRRLFATMIEDWRNRWGEGDFPFLFVQLANFKANGLWPVLRESQAEALRLRNTGMAVTIDIGNPANVHPTNTQEVGRRLALAARALVYAEAVEFSGPVYRQATGEGGALRVWFTHAEGMQAKGGGAVSGFTVAGKDGNFVPAEARIEGDTVVVSSPQVSAPAAVRYAWADDPECNLINREGLPAVPFRSGEPRYQ